MPVDHEDYLPGEAPAAHKETHQDGGTDEISIADLAGVSTELAAHALQPTVHQDAPTLILTHKGDASAHHAKYTDAEARAAINDIFGADGKADVDIDLDTHTLKGGPVISDGLRCDKVAHTFVDGDTTPSVLSGNVFVTANTAGTTITNFDDGRATQIITILFGDGNTTITRNNAYLAGGVNFVSTIQAVIVLLKIGAFWFEVSRSLNS